MKTINSFLIFLSLLFLNVSCDALNSAEGDEYLDGFISGYFTNWDLGDNKEIKFGLYDKMTGNFTQFGSALISRDGSFSFDTLSTPPHQILEAVSHGPGGDGECSNSLTISNPDVLIGFGDFFVTEVGSDEKIAEAIRTNNSTFFDQPVENSYLVEYIYSQEYVSVDGVNECVKDFEGRPHYEIIYSNLFLNEGWNKVVDKITYVAVDTLIREVNNWDPDEDEWVLLNRDLPPEGELYPFEYSGTIEDWNHGENKTIAFGGYDYGSDSFIKYAKADIDSEGNFSFTQALESSGRIMRNIIDALEDHPSCYVNLRASNPQTRIGRGEFIILDEANEQALGYILYGKEEVDNNNQVRQDYQMRFFFSDASAIVSGTTSCTWENDNGPSYNVKTFDVEFNNGWNAIYDGFNTFQNDTAYLDMNNTIPDELKWYFHNFDE